MTALRKATFTSGLRQVSISAAASLIASLVYAGARYELRDWIALHQAPVAATPVLTSGGKFAARVDSARAASDEVASALPLPSLPLLAVESQGLLSWQAARAAYPSLVAVATETAPAPAMPDTPGKAEVVSKPVKRVAARSDAKRRTGHDEAVPPIRSAVLTTADQPAAVQVAAPQGTMDGILSGTRGLVRATWETGAGVLQHVNPLSLLP